MLLKHAKSLQIFLQYSYMMGRATTSGICRLCSCRRQFYSSSSVTPTHVFQCNHRNTKCFQHSYRIIVCKGYDLSNTRTVSQLTGSHSQEENTSKFDGPSLKEFLTAEHSYEATSETTHDQEQIPYLKNVDLTGHKRKVFIETYGCQMNVNDTEIAWSILENNGFVKTTDITESDVILLVTCSVREGAETKIWKRLEYLKFLKKKRLREKQKSPLKIGILGCMAERLKTTILEKEKMVDVICGPDAYRDLPRLLNVDSGQAAVNVILSQDETYADVLPVRMNSDSPSAFVSIMRGCDNMCTYCVVPFTRGKERSRPINSIVDEVHLLSDQGIKEVTLLGQNVNSYRDTSEITSYTSKEPTNLAKGFNTVYKTKMGGLRFADLLERVSKVDPEMRIRFTSPHPKDFPDEVLYLIRDQHNICNHLHLPAQSGSTEVLKAMRRGYTRETYLELVDHIRSIIPDVSLTSDFIAGFCGESEQDHMDTLSLMDLVKYNFAFCFPYSMRQKTTAHRRLTDDVPKDVKSRRHVELASMFRKHASSLNLQQVGEVQLVLVEGVSKRSHEHLYGRNDGNTKVILPDSSIPTDSVHTADRKSIEVGDYIAVQITDSSSQVLIGEPLHYTTLGKFSNESINSRLQHKN